jgi:hypothetical protein
MTGASVRRYAFLLFVCFAMLVATPHAAAQEPVLLLFHAPAALAQTAGVAGKSRRVWTNPAGFVYSAEVTLMTGPSCKLPGLE